MALRLFLVGAVASLAVDVTNSEKAPPVAISTADAAMPNGVRTFVMETDERATASAPVLSAATPSKVESTTDTPIDLRDSLARLRSCGSQLKVALTGPVLTTPSAILFANLADVFAGAEPSESTDVSIANAEPHPPTEEVGPFWLGLPLEFSLRLDAALMANTEVAAETSPTAPTGETSAEVCPRPELPATARVSEPKATEALPPPELGPAVDAAEIEMDIFVTLEKGISHNIEIIEPSKDSDSVFQSIVSRTVTLFASESKASGGPEPNTLLAEVFDDEMFDPVYSVPDIVVPQAETKVVAEPPTAVAAEPVADSSSRPSRLAEAVHLTGQAVYAWASLLRAEPVPKPCSADRESRLFDGQWPGKPASFERLGGSLPGAIGLRFFAEDPRLVGIILPTPLSNDSQRVWLGRRGLLGGAGIVPFVDRR